MAMNQRIEPELHPVKVADLRPTQMTVGMREVREKLERLRKHLPKKIGTFLGSHLIPVVRGPKDRMYVIDHHHLALALHREGVRDILVSVVADLSELDADAFWTVLDHRSWVHPYDANGRRVQAAILTRVVPEVRDIRRAGSAALDLCAVACGRLDVYYERGVQAWDVAAAGLLVREAGGHAGTLDGEPLRRDSTWVASNRALYLDFRALIGTASGLADPPKC